MLQELLEILPAVERNYAVQGCQNRGIVKKCKKKSASSPGEEVPHRLRPDSGRPPTQVRAAFAVRSFFSVDPNLKNVARFGKMSGDSARAIYGYIARAESQVYHSAMLALTRLSNYLPFSVAPTQLAAFRDRLLSRQGRARERLRRLLGPRLHPRGRSTIS